MDSGGVYATKKGAKLVCEISKQLGHNLIRMKATKIFFELKMSPKSLWDQIETQMS